MSEDTQKTVKSLTRVYHKDRSRTRRLSSPRTVIAPHGDTPYLPEIVASAQVSSLVAGSSNPLGIPTNDFQVLSVT